MRKPVVRETVSLYQAKTQLSRLVDRAAAARVAGLPSHHPDPFDRLLVAHAEIEGLTLVTRDPVFERYAVERIQA